MNTFRFYTLNISVELFCLDHLYIHSISNR